MSTAHRRLAGLALSFTLGACARDTSLPAPPPPPGPGSLSGKVVRAQPGTGDRVPVEGAQVYVLNTGLRTLSQAGGTQPGSFRLEGLELTEGDLLIRWDSNGDGAPDQQRLLRLEDLGTGPGRQVSVGEVSVVENARIHGRVLRGDLAAAGGHGGTAVFVTQGPFTAFSGDDGSFVLDRLAAGTVSVAIARAGYRSVTLADLSLQAGQDLALSIVTLEVDPAGAGQPGGIQGHLDFAPATAAAASAVVTAADGAGNTLGASPNAAGDYAFAGVAPGLYQLRMALAGYADAAAANVLVSPGRTAAVAAVLMAPPPAGDRGPPTGGGGGPSCPLDAPCQPTDPCQVGVVTCPGDVATCTPIAAALNGTSCGTGLVCNSGSCAPLCAPGAACASPGDPCHRGLVACSASGVTCDTAGQPALADGASCGVGAVCHAGTCGPCATGAACPSANPCQAAAVACDTGLPVCAAVAALADGASCGPGQVCHAGACGACATGAACAPANPCHAGAVSCATGLPACQDAAVALPDGASCGTDQACHAGACGACAAGAACDGATGHGSLPAGSDPCLAYATACATGLPACAVAGNAPDGTSCGAAGSGNVCRAGSCGPAGNVLRLVGAAPHALPNQVVPSLTLQLVDTLGVPVLTPATVTLAGPAGAVLPAPAATSAADGTVTFATLRLGRPVGPQAFQASAAGLAVPLSFTLVADPPPDGTLIPLVGAAHADVLNGRTPGPGPAHGVSYVNSLAVANDGTVYFSEFASNYSSAGSAGCFVKRVRPDGALDIVAGDTTSCASTPSGPATTTPVTHPNGLALDEARDLLYVVEDGASRVSVIDLTLNMKAPFAGNGATSCGGSCGDGTPAVSAPVPVPGNLALGPESPPALYISDQSGIRRVDTSTGLISNVVATTGACVAGQTTVIYTRPAGLPGSVLAFDENGTLFFSGTFCAPETGTAYVPGIARRNADGTLTLVAGAASGSPSAGAVAKGVAFPTIPTFAFDGAPLPGGGTRSNLFLAPPSANWIAAVDGQTSALSLMAGSGAATTSGDFGPALAATLNNPTAVAFRKGTRDLYVAGGPSHSVWMIPGAGAAAATPRPTLASAGAVSAYPFQASTLAALLLDSSGAPIPGRDVAFSVPDPGSWQQAASARTDATGRAAVGARPGLAPGSYRASASYLDLHGLDVAGSPATVPFFAVPPPAGTIFSIVNQYPPAGGSIPGPSWRAALNQARGLVAAADGTTYLSDAGAIYRLRPSGVLESLVPAGVGIAPAGIALDEASGLLYVADLNGHVWSVDIAMGGLTHVAGGGATNADGPAAATSLFRPDRLALIGGLLYLSDWTAGAQRVRRIDPAAATIETFLASGSSTALPAGATPTACSTTGPVTFVGCGLDHGCSVAVSPGGRIYASGYVCGTGTNSTANNCAIVRVEPGGALSLVAGRSGFTVVDGSTADATGFPWTNAGYCPTIQTDASGNLWFAQPIGGTPRVGYLAADGTGEVGPSSRVHVVGPVSSGQSPGCAAVAEYVPSASGSFASPWAIGLLPGGHVMLSEPTASNGAGGATNCLNSIRVVW